MKKNKIEEYIKVQKVTKDDLLIFHLDVSQSDDKYQDVSNFIEEIKPIIDKKGINCAVIPSDSNIKVELLDIKDKTLVVDIPDEVLDDEYKSNLIKSFIDQLKTKKLKFILTNSSVGEIKLKDDKMFKMKCPLLKLDTTLRSGRIYPRHIVERSIMSEEFIHAMLNGGIPGQININKTTRAYPYLSDISHVVRKVYIEGDTLYGDIEILDTVAGKEAMNMLERGPREYRFAMSGEGYINNQDSHVNYLSINSFNLIRDIQSEKDVLKEIYK